MNMVSETHKWQFYYESVVKMQELGWDVKFLYDARRQLYQIKAIRNNWGASQGAGTQYAETDLIKEEEFKKYSDLVFFKWWLTDELGNRL